MRVAVVLIIAFSALLLGAGGAALALAFFRRNRTLAVPASTQPPANLEPTAEQPFRWKYVLLPLCVIFLSLGLTAIFYGQMQEKIAWVFKLNGTPSAYLAKGTVVGILLGAQALLLVLSFALVWSLGRLGRVIGGQSSEALKLSSVMLVMGNMLGLPQLVLFFAMLDIFSYNAYTVHLLPLWAFGLIVMVSGGIVLGIFFVRAMTRMSASRRKNSQEKKL
jgi:uncharacterized membrane protein